MYHLQEVADHYVAYNVVDSVIEEDGEPKLFKKALIYDPQYSGGPLPNYAADIEEYLIEEHDGIEMDFRPVLRQSMNDCAPYSLVFVDAMHRGRDPERIISIDGNAVRQAMAAVLEGKRTSLPYEYPGQPAARAPLAAKPKKAKNTKKPKSDGSRRNSDIPHKNQTFCQ